MKPTLNKAELVALRMYWQRWTTIVELFARQSRKCKGVQTADYCKGHRQLTEACRRLVQTHEGEERAFFETMLEMAEPWLTPRVLSHADCELLGTLLVRCREVQKKIGRPASAWRATRWMLLAGALVAAAVIALPYLQDNWLDLVSGMERVQGWSDALCVSVSRTSDSYKLLAATVLVVLVSVRLASRAAQF